MGTHMLENILQPKRTVLVFTILQTGIGTRVLGMNEEDKAVVCILLETKTLNRATGITGFSLFPLLKILHKLDHHLLSFLLPNSKVVQEARHIAEKEVVVADMNERVNRAVTAANRTANATRVVVVKGFQNLMHDVIDDRPLEIV